MRNPLFLPDVGRALEPLHLGGLATVIKTQGEIAAGVRADVALQLPSATRAAVRLVDDLEGFAVDSNVSFDVRIGGRKTVDGESPRRDATSQRRGDDRGV